MKGVSISYDEYAEYKILKKENKRLKERHAIRHGECLWCLSEPGGAHIHAAARSGMVANAEEGDRCTPCNRGEHCYGSVSGCPCRSACDSLVLCARCERIPRQRDSKFCPTCQAMMEEGQ